jgi:pyruvate/2-oxoglutarate dehydrogenase complex dihydrolipoamide acyltransferase (E2) component
LLPWEASSNGMEVREHLCLTVSFDHGIVDGAPAERLVRRLADLIGSGEAVSDGASGSASNRECGDG